MYQKLYLFMITWLSISGVLSRRVLKFRRPLPLTILSYVYKDRKWDQEFVSDAARDAYAMSHLSAEACKSAIRRKFCLVPGRLSDHCWIHSKANERRREPGPRAYGAVPYVLTQPASER